ncbi:tyrosine-type recombinase/integrase [uncultured Vibrio sp.]|uniref:tyrosine-type recombinase/integrase n=1 Tax=uncultured Vibrio sp. TaxID=114054 RepID=UPI002613E79C|nr:tyrosine-type recombinase/integrase [uncultured Vibrio sp.]
MPVVVRDFRVWGQYSPLEEKLEFYPVKSIPFITWENGNPCYEANAYMLSLLRSSKSTKVSGGTLRTYASYVDHLLRFCYKNQIRLTQLNDDWFGLFIRQVKGERKTDGTVRRAINSSVNVFELCLRFLQFVQREHMLKGFIGVEKGNSITITERQSYKFNEQGEKIVSTSISHDSIPDRTPQSKRLPISSDAADRLYEHVISQPNKYVRLRDKALYHCYDQLGARRTEVTDIRVRDLETARSSSPLKLSITTLKTKTESDTREIPVTEELIEVLSQYEKKVRRKILKKLKISPAEDHGMLFISTTTGRALSPNTVTNIVHDWKIAAGVTEKAHIHLFRHAFITQKLKELVLEHNEVNSVSDFKKHILNTEAFKMKLKEWTGHRYLTSLETYIHLAFEEIHGLKQIIDKALLRDSVNIVQKEVKALEVLLANNRIEASEAIEEISAIVSTFQRTIDIAMSGK